MATAVVLHKVRDYDAWRKVYDENEPVLHRGAGITAHSVHRAKDDPNSVLVVIHFSTMGEAEAFFSRDDLRDAMQQAGVESAPRIEFFEDASR